ncbi:MAG: tetratricopeptide repeat protein [Psychrobium sp.]
MKLLTPYLCLSTIALWVFTVNADDSPVVDTTKQNPNANAVVVVKKPTLGDLIKVQASNAKTQQLAPSLDKMITDYQHLVEITQAPQLREKIDYRLAQLLAIKGERAQEVGEPLAQGANGYYDSAINAYKAWLSQYPDSALNQTVMYELAKAHELQGETAQSFELLSQLSEKFPEQNLASDELNFRRGEYLFSQQNYRQAVEAYQLIVDRATTTSDFSSPYYQTALYMLGWAHYKLEQPKQSLAKFSEILDLNLPTKATTQLSLDNLPVSSKQLVSDAFKVMNLIFANSDGATSLANHYQSIGSRYFEYLHFKVMAEQLLVDKRYRDSAHTYDVFVSNYPAHFWSPQFAINKVNIYQQGSFPTLAKAEKAKYVASYGIDGPYWGKWSEQRQQEFSPTLKAYLSEMALDQYRFAQNANDKQEKIDEYAKAAELLLQYQRTFNDDTELAFLYGESLFASEQWRRAIDVYNHFAYGVDQTFGRERGKRADAAYAAILAFNQLNAYAIMPKPVSDELDKFELSEQERNVLQFANTFSGDERAVDVMFDLMNHRYAQARYSDAIEVVDNLANWQRPIEQARMLDAQLIKSHSVYNQGNYLRAITEYESVLAQLPQADDRKTVIANNLAASLFKYADQLATNKQLAKAVDFYLQVLSKTPDSPVRKLAHYNAAQYLYQLKSFEDAVTQLIAFKTRYPQDELAKDIDVQLASIYEQQQDWDKAASQRLAIANGMKKSTAQQEALYLTASFYERAGDDKNTILTLRRHANTYQAPFSRYMEVMHRLSDKYIAVGEQRKYRFWLNKMIKAHDSAGSEQTARSKFLAAQSALVFARDAKRDFDKIKLKLPLQASLARKTKSLEKTLSAYKKVSDYRVASFSTLSNYETAQVYRQLASDLMESQRPTGLDELALEQYEILLEEQAYPFEDQAIALFESNAKLTAQGLYDEWIALSLDKLSQLLPGRYNKVEVIEENADVIY